jgi:hypothetical protein
MIFYLKARGSARERFRQQDTVLMKWPIIILPFLAGCAPYQASQNADQLISNISDIREAQVIYNIGRAIEDSSMVPGAVVITQGTAQITQSLGVTLSWAVHFVKSLSSPLTNSWTSSWQLTPVTDGGDLQNLRVLYSFIVTKQPPIKATLTETERLQEATSKSVLQSFNTASPQGLSLLSVSLPPDPKKLAQLIIDGQSPECKSYQQERESTQLYNPWLFWYKDGSWHPQNPNPRYTRIPIGSHGYPPLEIPIYITSRACFDDFIILVQISVPAAHAAAAIGARGSSIVPAPAQ